MVYIRKNRFKKRITMTERLTEELINELQSAQSADEVLAHIEATPDADPLPLSDYLQQLLADKGLVQSKIVAASGVDRTYGYQLFTGLRKKPNRDYLLRIVITMRCSVRECNRALRRAGLSELYCKRRRDAIIWFGVTHQLSLARIDEELYRHGEATISSEKASNT